MVESGQIVLDGRSTPYTIRHLPVSSFPELPASVQNLLNLRGCLIPQTYEAHRPENVVQASLMSRGSSDWAVLCSENGSVSLLVFFAGSTAQPTVLASAPETEHLQPHGPNGVLGFDWGIDPAPPEPVSYTHLDVYKRQVQTYLNDVSFTQYRIFRTEIRILPATPQTPATQPPPTDP